MGSMDYSDEVSRLKAKEASEAEDRKRALEDKMREVKQPQYNRRVRRAMKAEMRRRGVGG